MGLVCVRGGAVDEMLLEIAFEKMPSLVVDCGSVCDPHKIFPKINQEQLHQVYVMNAEAIYRFRGVLRKLDYWISELGIKRIVVTTINTLFSYDDEFENFCVLEHCWEIMKRLSLENEVYVGVKGRIHEDFSMRFADRFVDE